MGNEIVAITSRSETFLESNLDYIRVDWRNFSLPDLEAIDCVFHLAHQTSAYLARQNVVDDVRENLLMTTELINHLKKTNLIPKFIYLGSLTEFGTDVSNPIQDKALLKPETFYDASKIATETYLEQFYNEGWIHHLLILRLGNLYGLTSNNEKVHRGFLDKSIASAADGSPLLCFGTGKYLRDFIHVNDVIEILVRSALEETENKREILKFNVATGVGTSILDALKAINHCLVDLGKSSVEIQFLNFPPNSYRIETRSHFADISGISQRFDWRPKIHLHQGVQLSLRALLGENLDSEYS